METKDIMGVIFLCITILCILVIWGTCVYWTYLSCRKKCIKNREKQINNNLNHYYDMGEL